LLNAAGQSLQDECTKKAPVKIGNVVITGPGKLPCKYVLHTVIPSYDGKASEKVTFA
jgi:O-acetyl-ADP-ribose deacetylase (regulator of RNase III)